MSPRQRRHRRLLRESAASLGREVAVARGAGNRHGFRGMAQDGSGAPVPAIAESGALRDSVVQVADAVSFEYRVDFGAFDILLISDEVRNT